jgi:DNA polymerase III psi subunit
MKRKELKKMHLSRSKQNAEAQLGMCKYYNACSYWFLNCNASVCTCEFTVAVSEHWLDLSNLFS